MLRRKEQMCTDWLCIPQSHGFWLCILFRQARASARWAALCWVHVASDAWPRSACCIDGSCNVRSPKVRQAFLKFHEVEVQLGHKDLQEMAASRAETMPDRTTRDLSQTLEFRSLQEAWRCRFPQLSHHSCKLPVSHKSCSFSGFAADGIWKCTCRCHRRTLLAWRLACLVEICPRSWP